jgi:hypothetical protein
MRKLLLTSVLIGATCMVAPLMAAEPPSAEVAAMLQYMRQEEKLAHDVYELFGAMYEGLQPGAKIFGRISESEQRHADAVVRLLDAYGLVDEAAGLAPGEFANPELQEMYATLVSVGEAGYAEALGVGVLIEQKDVTDIVAAIELSVAYPDIVKVYTNLLAASGNHLDAFMKVLERPEESSSAAKLRKGR